MNTIQASELSSVTDIKVLDCLLALNLDVTIWSARKKLSPEDFGGVELPPGDLASLGSKRICDPDSLKIFTTLKSRAFSILDRRGVRFLGGWAIPEAQALDVVTELQKVQADFLTAKAAFLAGYDDAVQDWIIRHPGWESIIAESTVSADYVRSKLSFDWQVYKIVNPQEMQNLAPAVSEGLEQAVSGLGMTLYDEIAAMADEAWKRTFSGRTSITRKALSPLKTIMTKLRGLSFMEPRVAPIVELIRTALDTLPKAGEIAGRDVLMLQGLVCLLREPHAIIEHGQMVLDGKTPAAVLTTLFAAPSLEESVAEQTSNVEEGGIPAPAPMPKPVDLGDMIQPLSSTPELVITPIPSPTTPLADFPVQGSVPTMNSLGLW